MIGLVEAAINVFDIMLTSQAKLLSQSMYAKQMPSHVPLTMAVLADREEKECPNLANDCSQADMKRRPENGNGRPERSICIILITAPAPRLSYVLFVSQAVDRIGAGGADGHIANRQQGDDQCQRCR